MLITEDLIISKHEYGYENEYENESANKYDINDSIFKLF